MGFPNLPKNPLTAKWCMRYRYINFCDDSQMRCVKIVFKGYGLNDNVQAFAQ